MPAALRSIFVRRDCTPRKDNGFKGLVAAAASTLCTKSQKNEGPAPSANSQHVQEIKKVFIDAAIDSRSCNNQYVKFATVTMTCRSS